MNPVDKAIDSVESSVDGKKRGPRPRYFFCIALRPIDKQNKKVDDNGLIYQAVNANSEQEARESFEKIHKIAPLVCDSGVNMDGGGTGFYLAMGTGMTTAQRVSVTVTPDQLVMRTASAIRAKLTIDGRDYPLCGSGLRACTVKIGHEDHSFKDNELYSVEFKDAFDDSQKKLPKPKLKKREVVRLQDLKDVQHL